MECQSSKGFGDFDAKAAATQAAAEKEFSIFENLEGKPLLQFHPRRPKKRANRFGCPSLAAYHFSQVLGMDAQFQDGHLRPFDRFYLDVLGMVHEGSSDGFDQLLHLGNSA